MMVEGETLQKNFSRDILGIRFTIKHKSIHIFRTTKASLGEYSRRIVGNKFSIKKNVFKFVTHLHDK